MSDKEELKKEIEETVRQMIAPIIEKTMREVEKQLRSVSLRIDLSKEELEEMEPSSIVLRDIANVLKESIKRGLRERGEAQIDELILKMPENKASSIMKSLANEDRIKLLKILYKNPMSFSELKESLNLESSSMSYNLRQLLSAGLITHDETEMRYKISNRGKMLLRLLALINETLGGEVYE
ncbi:MAG TPA: winged helix-turn-helix domain-containing protein [Geobacterales bacterium]|nr:winged helix-turn-helix domain-containing protein [Geobacterales bacterium]